MSGIRSALRKLAQTKSLRPFATIFETLDAFIFGQDLVTAGAPHIVDNIEIKRYMSVMVIALLPPTVAAVVFWGARVLLIILVSYVVGAIVEVAFAVIRKRHIEEGFLITGLIFPLVLPPTVPLGVVAVGIVVATLFGKEVFGGTGRNIFNPALVGRLFVTIAFPQIMSSSWEKPYTDAITSATPLTTFKIHHQMTPYLNLLLGHVGGSMGEVFRIGIILGGIFLLITKVGNWRIPVSYLLSVVVFSAIGNALNPTAVAPPLFQLLSGGLLFGAFYMATDPITSPYNKEGKYVFGVLLGLVTIVIRSFSGYTEGVMFSIIFMNALTPLIDHLVMRRKYPEARE